MSGDGNASRLRRQLLAQGNKLAARGCLKDAIRNFEQAVQADPNSPEAYRCLGMAYFSEGRLPEAGAMWFQATKLNPDDAASLSNLGMVLRRLHKYADAEETLRQALRLDPKMATAHANLGVVLRDQGRLREAELAGVKAVELDRNSPEFHCFLATTLSRQGRTDEALVAYHRAIKLRANYVAAHHDMAIALLGGGYFADGWREFEWRWKHIGEHKYYSTPAWNGEDLQGRTILLHGEQGLGDSLQFVRYARLMAAQGARVVVEVPAPLKRLVATVPGVAEVVAESAAANGQWLPSFDYHLPMMSAPRVFRTDLSNIPAEIPYVFPEAAAVAEWARKMKGLKGLRVGLVWAGSPLLKFADHRRSLPLSALLPFLSMGGISFVSLQMGDAAGQIAALPRSLRPWNPMDEVSDFADTAALVANLDLVIGVDTSVVHLAGALGKPVWILSRFDACWRWLIDRDDSPWYPTARLFRQTTSGNWADVVARVAAALKERANTR